MRSFRVALLLPCLLALPALASCGKGGEDEKIADAAGSGTTSIAPGAPAAGDTAPATQSYTIVAGDSLYAIGQRYCTSASAIAEANGWSEGIDHPIFPDDVIAVPAQCTPSATPGSSGSSDTTQPAAQSTTKPTDPAATTPVTASDDSIDAWLRDHEGFVPDPMYGDPSDYSEDFGTVCMTAWEKTYEFEKLGLGKADVLKALDKLPGSVPASVEDAVDTWAAFTQEWYLRYQDLVERHTSVQGGASSTDYDALVLDPDYREFLAHYLPVADAQSVAHTYASDLCSNLLATKGSTP